MVKAPNSCGPILHRTETLGERDAKQKEENNGYRRHPRSRNADDKVIQGKEELDAYIQAELQAMVREGLEKSPIQPATLHARLKAKGIVKGLVSP